MEKSAKPRCCATKMEIDVARENVRCCLQSKIRDGREGQFYDGYRVPPCLCCFRQMSPCSSPLCSHRLASIFLVLLRAQQHFLACCGYRVVPREEDDANEIEISKFHQKLRWCDGWGPSQRSFERCSKHKLILN